MTRSILCTLLIIIISCGNALARQTAATGNPKETAAPAAAIAPAAAGTISTEEEAPATGNAPAAEAPASEAAVPADGQKQLQALKAAEVQSPIRGKKQFLPTRRRIDREINKLKFAYKGEVIMGLTASYGTMSSDDTDIMLILDGIDADGTVATVKPFIGYFYRDNNCLGVRFGYRHMDGNLDAARYDLGESNDASGSSFESVRFVDVTCHGITERWLLYVEPTNVKVALRATDLWNNTATATALVSAEEYAAGAALEYRIKGATEWQRMAESSYEAGILTATLAPEWSSSTNPHGLAVYNFVPDKGLFAGHTYEFRLTVGGEQTQLMEYAAPAGNTIPNGDLEDSSLSCWTQNNKTAEFWGSGNNTFTRGLCTQASFDGGTRAKLQATPAVGVLASGNLFSGLFQKDVLTRGVVSFGQPYAWKARPKALKLQYYAEHIGIVDIEKNFGAPIHEGDRDKARIMVAIVDWNTRREVGSGTEAPTGTWDPEEMSTLDEGPIIAYGSLFIDQSSTGGKMIDVQLPLNFYDTKAKPSGLYQIVISCSTSAYGDFMAGCKSNVLYVDNFEWVY